MSGIKAQRTLCSEDKLKEALSVLNDISLSIQEMIDTDKSMNKICQSHGIDWLKMRNMIIMNLDKVVIDENKKASLSSIQCPEKDPYLHFYSTVIGIKYEELCNYDLPNDLESTIDHVLNHYDIFGLTKKESLVLKYRFGFTDDAEAKYLDEIAEILNVTRERIRQIEAKSLRKLRKPSIYNLIRYGQSYQKEEMEAKKEAAIKINEERKKRVEERTNQILNEHLEQSNTIEDVIQYTKEITIHDLEMSVRAHNCCLRAGKKFLFDLAIMSDEDIMKMRNVGNGTFKEICETVNKFISKFNYNRKTFYTEYWEMYNSFDDTEHKKDLLDEFKQAKTYSDIEKALLEQQKTLEKEFKKKCRDIERSNKTYHDLYEKYKTENNELKTSNTALQSEMFRLKVKSDIVENLQYKINNFNPYTDMLKDLNTLSLELPYPPRFLGDKEKEEKLLTGMKMVMVYLYTTILNGQNKIHPVVVQNAISKAKSYDKDFDLNYDEFMEIFQVYCIRRKWCNEKILNELDSNNE